MTVHSPNKGSNSVGTSLYEAHSTICELIMATAQELMRVEDSEKEKFLELVRHLSLLELKKFQKHEYAELVFQDMSKFLIGKDQLKEASHYVSNALDTERSSS